MSSPEIGASTVRTMYYLSIICARRSIYIANPYFVPDAAAIDALVEAKRRGVDVRVMVSGIHNDNWLARQNSVRLFGPLLEAGIEIHEYNRTMLHHKTMVVDGCGPPSGRRTSTTGRSRTTRRTTSAATTATSRAGCTRCSRPTWPAATGSRWRPGSGAAWCSARRNSSPRSSKNRRSAAVVQTQSCAASRPTFFVNSESKPHLLVALRVLTPASLVTLAVRQLVDRFALRRERVSGVGAWRHPCSFQRVAGWLPKGKVR